MSRLAHLLRSVSLIACTYAVAADAETQPERFLLALDRQRMDVALQLLAKQCGVQVVFLSRVTQGLNAPALEGQYTLAAALDRILEGSQLTFRLLNPQTVEIRPRQAKPSAPPPKPVQARATALPGGAGANARSGPAPLEEIIVNGLAEQLVATRVPTPLWEIPQTISVISREQIRAQNSVDLGDALRRATGVTLARSSSLDGDFYMRGYSVPTLHIDGGAALNPAFLRVSQVSLAPVDLSEFDHIEILRGSDALFSGIGSPGGTVSLVRKAPQRVYALETTATLGSWDNFRAELDVTGPLAFDTALRGRATVISSQRKYFYDDARTERAKIFGALAYDITPRASVTFGASHQRDAAVPFVGGLPSYDDGGDPELSRQTSLVFDWQRQHTRNTGGYLQYAQDFGGDWTLRFNVARWRSEAELAQGSFEGLIDPMTHGLSSPNYQFSLVPGTVRLGTADVNVTGVFDWFGWREELAVGGDASRMHSRSRYQLFDPHTPLADVRHFDPSAYPDPRLAEVPYHSSTNRSTATRYGAFASLRVYFDDAWSVVGGVRVGSDTYTTSTQGRRGSVTVQNSASSANHGIVTPYAGAMVTIGQHYSLYASYADIYNTMSLFEGPDGHPLEESHGVTVEAGVKGRWRNGAINGSLALYRIENRKSERRAVRRAPGSVSHGGICCFVAENSVSEGVDLELNGELVRGWSVGIGYTYNENEGPEGTPLSMLTPPHLLKAWTDIQLPGAFRGWTIGGNLHAQSTNDVRAEYCSLTDCHDIEAKQGSHAVLDLRVGIDISTNWQVAVSLNNALDKTYYESIGGPAMHRWYGEPRNWTLRLDGRY